MDRKAHLIRYTGMHVLPLPQGCGRREAERIGEATAARFGVGPGDFLDPALAALGGRVGHGMPMGLEVRPDGTFTVRVSSMQSLERQRMDAAMAIGHRILHFPAASAAHPDLPMCVPYNPPEDEDPSLRTAMRETHWFAWAFTMPEAAFRAAWERHEGNDRLVGRRFGVVGRHARLRAEGLSLAEREPDPAPTPAP